MLASCADIQACLHFAFCPSEDSDWSSHYRCGSQSGEIVYSYTHTN